MTRDLSTDPDTLLKALEAVVEPGDDFVVLHSALYAFKLPGEELKWPLLRALRRLQARGHTIVVPTFTLSFLGGRPFHARDSRSESGLLGDWFLTLDGVRRSAHPVYSFAVSGPRAEEVLDCANSTTFASDSPFGLFERADARLVMLGCGWDSCTQFHFCEEAAEVPYRAYKTFQGQADYGVGPAQATVRMYVRDLDIDPVNALAPIAERMRSDGKVKSVEVGPGRVESVSCKALVAEARQALRDDPYALVSAGPVVRYRLENKRKRSSAEPLRLALLGQANLDILRGLVESTLSELVTDRRVEVFTAEFGQAYQEVIDPRSPLHDFKPDIVVFADRLEEIYRVDSLDEAVGQESEALERYLEMVAAAAESFEAKVFVQGFANLQSPAFGLADGEAQDGIARLVAEANAALADAFRDNPSVTLLDLQGLAARFAGGSACDARLWHLGRIPFSQPFSQELAKHYAGLVLALTGRSVRLLVLDLDNTLWGGVLGEEGLEGLQLGGDYPGNAYLRFQKTLRRLSERGIALAVASKNDEREARAAIAALPGMILKEEDFAALRIDWRDKPGNLLEMAGELGLGLESIAFVDDNAAERARMRLMLPAVKVIELPDDPAGYAEALLQSPYLECLGLTQEDRKRAKQYAGRRVAAEERQRFGRVEDFYRYLDARVHIQPLSPTNAARAEQLAAKTNQFNTTTRRYSRSQLEALARDDGGVYVIGLEDRFTELENIGLVVLRHDSPDPGGAEIDLFLLSCRILGRGVESAVLSWLADETRQQGFERLVGLVIESERNAPAREIYAQHGYRRGKQPGCWTLDLAGERPALPDWIKLLDHTGEASRVA